MKKFKAESQKLLDMMINSIYTNKDIFLRELISNASDALDKMHVAALDNKEASFSQDQFWIRLTPNKEERTLTIEDSGIGMNAAELEENLGTIAHSGTADFKKSNSEKENLENIIGQFGVGFYSAFMVADLVEVLSKKYGEEEAYLWKSDGSKGFTVEPAEKEGHGSKITLHIRPNSDDDNYDQYLETWNLEQLVREYSNYIRYAIHMEVKESRPVQKDDDQPADDQEAADSMPKYEEVLVDKTLNSMIPIWNQSKSELKDEDYIHFYQQEHFGVDDPLHWIHIVVDGTLSYRAILYIPKQLPFDFYSRNFKKGLSLYSHGVKIMDHCEELLPDYFGFIQGVVASDDFTLNVSRETLQENRQLQALARQIENKLLDALKRMMKNEPDKYKEFFTAFGKQIKGGIYSSYGMNTDKLAPLLVFASSKDEGLRSLDQIVDDLEKADAEEKAAKKAEVAEGAEAGTDDAATAEGADAEATSADAASDEATGAEDEADEEPAEKSPIPYVTGESIASLDRLPALKKMKEEGKEVIYCTDPIDEFTFKAMFSYKDHPFKSLQAAEEPAEGEEEESGLFKEMKKYLEDEVVAVRKSDRLAEDAVMLTATGEISIDMEKTWARQGVEGVPMVAQKVLEINPKHPIYKQLQAWYVSEDYDKIKEYTELLYDQARLIEGLPLKDPVAFSQRVQKLMSQE